MIYPFRFADAGHITIEVSSSSKRFAAGTHNNIAVYHFNTASARRPINRNPSALSDVSLTGQSGSVYSPFTVMVAAQRDFGELSRRSTGRSCSQARSKNWIVMVRWRRNHPSTTMPKRTMHQRPSKKAIGPYAGRFYRQPSGGTTSEPANGNDYRCQP